jgi:long-chain acyl-CoA synthetase
LEAEAISAYAGQHQIAFRSVDELGQHPTIIRLIEAEIAERNKSLAPFETIKKFTIVPEFTIDNEMVTPTLKLKKSVILERFKDRIDDMYR